MGNENNTIRGVVQAYSYTHSYNYTPQRARGERVAPFYLGVELECECDHYNRQTELDDIANSIPCIMARDGSLRTSGAVEIITEPLSFKRWQELEPNFKALWSRLIDYGYKSHDVSTCGLHIHVTRPSDDVIDRIIFIMETYKNELVKFARRGGNSYSQWYSDTMYFSNDQLKSLEFIKNNKSNLSNERYMALNLRNSKTIEFRFFKGTLNGTTYMACVELINNLVTLCSDLNRPLSRITWNLLTQGTNCKEYCKQRGISKSNIIPKDMTSEYLRAFTRDKRKVSKIIKILNNEILKQTSLFQLDIKTTLPPINNGLSNGDFKDNLTNYSQMISDKTSKLNSTISQTLYTIRELRRGINANGYISTEWLKSAIKDYVYSYSNSFTENTINEIKKIVGGEE